MSVDIKLFGELARATGASRELVVPVSAADLSEAIRELTTLYPLLGGVLLTADGTLRPEVNILVNGRPSRASAGLETCLEDGDRVHILTAFGGG
jgi:molybdopterin converting factor small subunit